MYETVYKSYSERQKGGLTTKCYGQLFEGSLKRQRERQGYQDCRASQHPEGKTRVKPRLEHRHTPKVTLGA